MSDYAWINSIKKGDVLKSPTGTLRIVRGVTHGGSICKTFVQFTILRCSWTRRPTTTVDGQVLKRYSPTGANIPLTGELDAAIERDSTGRAGKYPLIGSEREIFCCDVRGMA